MDKGTIEVTLSECVANLDVSSLENKRKSAKQILSLLNKNYKSLYPFTGYRSHTKPIANFI